MLIGSSLHMIRFDYVSRWILLVVDIDLPVCTGRPTGGPTQNSASGQISVSEKAKKCMENEKVLRPRISPEK